MVIFADAHYVIGVHDPVAQEHGERLREYGSCGQRDYGRNGQESLYPRRRRHYYARTSVATSVDVSGVSSRHLGYGRNGHCFQSRPIRSVQSSSSSVVVLKELKVHRNPPCPNLPYPSQSKSCQTTTQGVRADSRQVR